MEAKGNKEEGRSEKSARTRIITRVTRLRMSTSELALPYLHPGLQPRNPKPQTVASSTLTQSSLFRQRSLGMIVRDEPQVQRMHRSLRGGCAFLE